MSTLLAPNHFRHVKVYTSADVKEKEKKRKTPRIRFISEGKTAKSFYLGKMINVYSAQVLQVFWGIHDDTSLVKKAHSPVHSALKATKQDSVPDSESLKDCSNHLVW